MDGWMDRKKQNDGWMDIKMDGWIEKIDAWFDGYIIVMYGQNKNR